MHEAFLKMRRPCKAKPRSPVVFVSGDTRYSAGTQRQRWSVERVGTSFTSNGDSVEYVNRLTRVLVPNPQVEGEVRTKLEVILEEVILVVFSKRQCRIARGQRDARRRVVK